MKNIFEIFFVGCFKKSDERKIEKNFGGTTILLLLHTPTRHYKI